MTIRVFARRSAAALSIGLLFTLGCGAEDQVTSLEAGADTDPLIGLAELGLRLDEEGDEAPGFGSEAFRQEFGEDEAYPDDRFDGEDARGPNRDARPDGTAPDGARPNGDRQPPQADRPRGLMVKVLWGQLRANPNASSVIDWTGGLFGDGVDVRLHRVIRFEGRDEIIRPTDRRDRGSVQWISHTRPHHDGVLVELLPRADASGAPDPSGRCGDGTTDPNAPGDRPRPPPGQADPNDDPADGSNRPPPPPGQTDPNGDPADDANRPRPGHADPNDGEADEANRPHPPQRPTDPTTRPCREPSVTFRTVAFTHRFSIEALREGRVIAIDDEGNRLLIQALQPPRCAAGFVDGRWVDLPNHDGGVFGGRWVAERGGLRGHVLGRYGADADGNPFFRGKLIDHAGRHLGRVSGSWHAFGPAGGMETDRPPPPAGGATPPERGDGSESAPNGDGSMRRTPNEDPSTRPDPAAPRPTVPGGMFHGEWQTRAGPHGRVGGHYHAGGSGSGFFAGHWAEICGRSGPANGSSGMPGPGPDDGNRPDEGGTPTGPGN